MNSFRDAAAPTSQPPVVRLADYQPPSHTVGPVDLHFALGLAETIVTIAFPFEARIPGAPLVLDGEELTLLSAQLNDEPLPAKAYTATPDQFVLHAPPAQGRLSLTVRIHPEANTELMGLYASRGGLYTQCESQGFRRIAYFLDRPDVMTTYRVVLQGPADLFPTLLSNGNLESETTENGVHTAVWHDPFPKPCYLFALVAARLAHIESWVTTRSGKKKLLQVYTKPEDLGRAQFALQSLERSVAWDEHRFGFELDLERFMIVAVPDFNSGAMENKGLNLFNTRFILADPDTATDRDYELIEAVIGHEYFHNYTGNRITCRDWFQLTLKEGLTVFRDQEFTADMLAEGLSAEQAASARAVKRIDDVRVLRAAQFPEDAGPMAHPIRPAQYEEIRNFYTATVYEKGAEVIRMLQTLFGVEGFAKGMALYFERHDGTAATCEDFVSSILDANGRNDLMAQWMGWYRTLGTPQLRITTEWDSARGELQMHLEQKLDPRNAALAPEVTALPIPIRWGLLTADGHPLPVPGSDVLLMHSPRLTHTIHLPMAAGGPAPMVSALREFSAPVLLEPPAPETLAIIAAQDSDAFNRWDALQQLILDQLMPSPTAGRDLVLSAMAATLADERLSPAFMAQALSLPSESVVAEAYSLRAIAADPEAIHARCESLKRAMASHPSIRASLLRWDAEVDVEAQRTYAPDPLSSGRRALALLAQALLLPTRDAQEAGRVLLQRLRISPHITGRIAHLHGLLRLSGDAAAEGLEIFYRQAQGNALALDKWFSAQAMACPLGDPTGSGVVDRIHALLQHADYDVTNPNRVRAVLSTFFSQNPVGFHQADGQGYALWADALGTLDARNSQLAARLARSLDRWAIYEPGRKEKMRAAIAQLAAKPGLSPDMAEVCGRLLV